MKIESELSVLSIEGKQTMFASVRARGGMRFKRNKYQGRLARALLKLEKYNK